MGLCGPTRNKLYIGVDISRSIGECSTRQDLQNVHRCLSSVSDRTLPNRLALELCATRSEALSRPGVIFAGLLCVV